MTNFLNNYPNQKWYKRPKLLVPIVIIAIIIIALIFSLNNKNGEVAGEKITPKTVKTTVLDKNRIHANKINTAGIVKADSKVDIVAMVNGTVRGVNFKVGDIVPAGAVLANLYDSTLLTNMGNAQANFSNTQQSYTSAQRLTDESVHQAQQAIDNAEIGLNAAQDNLDNISELQTRTRQNTLSNAVIGFAGHLNTANNTLYQINYLIKAEGGNQMPGVEATLGATSIQSLINAKNSYKSAKAAYNNLALKNINTGNINQSMQELLSVLNLTKSAVDGTIVVLDNSISSPAFPESSLNAQKNSFTALRSTIVGTITAAQTTTQSLQNIDLIQKQELDGLQNAYEAAKNQLARARSAYNNTLESKNQQLISAQTALDASRGQLNLMSSQVGDLTVKAPISGQITQKLVELGAELNPGQKIAEISKTDLVKIELSLTSEDIYRVEIGQVVLINDSEELGGYVSRIDPAADPITKKVGVEIAFDNKNKELIPETFVDVTIPTTRESARSIFSDNSFLVPLKAVTITQTETYVFLLKNGVAVKTAVTIGASEGDKIEIISGLNDGDELIIEGNRGLEGGEQLNVIARNGEDLALAK